MSQSNNEGKSPFVTADSNAKEEEEQDEVVGGGADSPLGNAAHTADEASPPRLCQADDQIEYPLPSDDGDNDNDNDAQVEVEGDGGEGNDDDLDGADLNEVDGGDGDGWGHDEEADDEEADDDDDEDDEDALYEFDDPWADPFHMGHHEEWWDDVEDMWVDDDDDEAQFWGEEDDEDGFSDVSTIEPEQEAEACDRAALITEDRHLLTPPVGYFLPSATFHFQSADALAVCPDPHHPDSTLVCTMDADGVLLFRMPPPNTVTQLGGAAQPMTFLGGFESPSLSAYSMEFSPSGKYMVAGGDEGALEIYAIDSLAPQRPPVPTQVFQAADMSTHQPFFYLPIIPPETDWVTGMPPKRVAKEIHDILRGPPVLGQGLQGQQQHLLPYTAPRTLNDARFLNILGFRENAMLAPSIAPEVPPVLHPEGSELVMRPQLGWVPRDIFFGAAVNDQFRGLKAQFKMFAGLVGGAEKIEWQMEDEIAVDDGGGGGTNTAPSDKQKPPSSVASLPSSPQKGAIALAGMMILGYPTQEAAEESTMNMDGMLNGVRFGVVGGKERLLAADQSGRVYIFEVPPDDCPTEGVVAAMMCTGLDGDASTPNWSMQPVVSFAASLNPMGSGLHRRAVVHSTATLRSIGSPVNLAVASPDGRWIAVIGDTKKVVLVDQHDNFSSRELAFEPARTDYEFMDPDVQTGAQYCTFNASSSLLAVTSDALHAVFVFSMPTGALVMRIEGFMRSVMPLTFAPWDDHVLIFAEESKQMHVRRVIIHSTTSDTHDDDDDDDDVINYNAREDLAEPGPTSQLVRLPADPLRPRGGRRRVTGMGVSSTGDVLVSTKQGVLLRYLPNTPWTPEETKHWPEKFREAVQVVLQCASTSTHSSSSRSEGCLLSTLPPPLLHMILGALAGKRSDWLVRIEAVFDEAVFDVRLQEEEELDPAEALAIEAALTRVEALIDQQNEMLQAMQAALDAHQAELAALLPPPPPPPPPAQQEEEDTERESKGEENQDEDKNE